MRGEPAILKAAAASSSGWKVIIKSLNVKDNNTSLIAYLFNANSFYTQI
jgi:hypothetical protein